MPSNLKIRVERARDLPVMDRNLQGDASTDAYVEVKLESQFQRTRTCRKSLNPVFNEEFTFAFFDDSDLQDIPLEMKVMDQDLYSSEMIGVVYVDLTPLLMRTAHSSDKDLVIQGWFPLFDTTKGIRGSLKATIKLQFIGNDDPFRDSSAGVQFFSASSLSNRAFIVQEVLGFVVDLVVEDDPESSWQDYFRKGNKTTNDSRLKVLYNLSAQVRREIGKKVLELGGNAVLGYQSHFDIGGTSSGLVARAYGTACRLLKVGDPYTSSIASIAGASSLSLMEVAAVQTMVDRSDWAAVMESGGALAAAVLPSGSTGEPMELLPRSVSKAITEQLILLRASTPTAGKVAPLISFGPASDKLNIQRDAHGIVAASGSALTREWTTAGPGENAPIFQSEVQLLSLVTFGRHVRVRLGGLVMARSVKFLGKLEQTLSDQETREGWWEELRDEIKTHARTLCCSHIIGYTETCTIYGDVCVLNAVGTAAVVKYLTYPTALIKPNPLDGKRTPPKLGMKGSTSLVDDDDTDKVLYDDDGEEEEEEEEDEYDFDEDDEEVAAADDTQQGIDRHGRRIHRSRNGGTGQSNNGSKVGSQLRRHSSVSQGIVSAGNEFIQVTHPPNSLANASSGSTGAAGGGSGGGSKSPGGSSSDKLGGGGGGGGGGGLLPNKLSVASGSGWDLSMYLSGGTGMHLQPLSGRGQANRRRRVQRPCSYVHVPYNHSNAPFDFMRLVPCAACGRKWVPETILATIEPFPALAVKGKGQLLESRICRVRRVAQGEGDAVRISEVLPFVEYDVQKQLMLKMKVAGMNACFGYTCKIQVGSDMIIAMATCTAVCLEALPAAPSLHFKSVSRDVPGSDARLLSLQRDLEELHQMNKAAIESEAVEAAAELQALRSAQLPSRQKRSGSAGAPSGRTGGGRDGASRSTSRSIGRSGSLDDRAEDEKSPDALHSTRDRRKRSVESVESPDAAARTANGLRAMSFSSNTSSHDDPELRSRRRKESNADSSSSSSSSSSSTSSSSSSDENDDSSLESPPSSSSSSTSSSSSESGSEGSRSDEEESPSVRKERGEDGDHETGSSKQEGELKGDALNGEVKPRKSAKKVVRFPPSPSHEERLGSNRQDTIAGGSGSGGGGAARARLRQRPIHRQRRQPYKDDRPPVVLEIDDETDSDMLAVLMDWYPPVGIDMVNTMFLPGGRLHPVGIGRNVTVMLRRKMSVAMRQCRQKLSSNAASSIDVLRGGIGVSHATALTGLFKEAYLRLCISLKYMMPCQVLGLTHSVNILEEDMVEIMITAMTHECVPIRRVISTASLSSANAAAHSSSGADLRLRSNTASSTGSFVGSKSSNPGTSNNAHTNAHTRHHSEGNGSSSNYSGFDPTDDGDDHGRERLDSRTTSSAAAAVAAATAAPSAFPALRSSDTPPPPPPLRLEATEEGDWGLGIADITPRIGDNSPSSSASVHAHLDGAVVRGLATTSPAAPDGDDDKNSAASDTSTNAASGGSSIVRTAGNRSHSFDVALLNSNTPIPVRQSLVPLAVPVPAPPPVIPQTSTLVKSEPSSNFSSPKAGDGSPKKTIETALPDNSPIIADRSISNAYFYPSSQISDHVASADAPQGNTGGGSSDKSSLKIKAVIRSTNSSVKSDRGSPFEVDSASGSPRGQTTTSRPSSQAFNQPPPGTSIPGIIPLPHLTHSISASSGVGFVSQGPVPSAESSVLLTPLDFVPGARVKRYLGPVQLHFIKDSWALRGESGTPDYFSHLFISEVNASARAQVAALGGNALLCHRIVSQESGGRVYRNQAYSMFSVIGDAVLVESSGNGNGNGHGNHLLPGGYPDGSQLQSAANQRGSFIIQDGRVDGPHPLSSGGDSYSLGPQSSGVTGAAGTGTGTGSGTSTATSGGILGYGSPMSGSASNTASANGTPNPDHFSSSGN